MSVDLLLLDDVAAAAERLVTPVLDGEIRTIGQAADAQILTAWLIDLAPAPGAGRVPAPEPPQQEADMTLALERPVTIPAVDEADLPRQARALLQSGTDPREAARKLGVSLTEVHELHLDADLRESGLDNMVGMRPRPFWQTGPCPPWCDDKHDDSDQPEDRVHFLLGGEATVDLSQHAPNLYSKDEWRPEYAAVGIRQRHDAIRPYVTVRVGDGVDVLTLTVAEARQMAAGLTRIADLAEGRSDLRRTA